MAPAAIVVLLLLSLTRNCDIRGFGRRRSRLTCISKKAAELRIAEGLRRSCFFEAGQRRCSDVLRHLRRMPHAGSTVTQGKIRRWNSARASHRHQYQNSICRRAYQLSIIDGKLELAKRKAEVMRNIKLHRAIILAGAIALGSGCATVDAFARGGAGGAGGAGGGHAGHAAASSGVGGGHAGVAGSHAGVASGHGGIAGTHAGSISPGTSIGRAGPMHTSPGTVSVRFGNTTVTE